MIPLAISDDKVDMQTSQWPRQTWAGGAAAFASAVLVTGHKIGTILFLELTLLSSFAMHTGENSEMP